MAAHSYAVTVRSDLPLELTRLSDGDLLTGFATLGAVRLNLLDDIHAFDNSAEDDVFAVEPRGLHCRQKELRAVRIRTCVGHRENTGSGVLELEVLVGKLGAIDRLSSGAVMVSEVSALTHEVRDHPMECRALITEALLSRTQRPEVLRRLWGDV